MVKIIKLDGKNKIEGNPFSMTNLIIRMNNGESDKDIKADMERVAREKAKEKGKTYGKCESCDLKTVLVEEVGLCGPCCFGEADTVCGNW